MPINITNIINVVSTKLAALDSNSDPVDIKALSTIDDYIVNVGGVLKYQSESDLPIAKRGRFAFVENQIDSGNTGSLFVGLSADSGWSRVFMTADSADSAGDVVFKGGAAIGYQGSVSGYAGGGNIGPTYYSAIDKFSFTSDGGGTDVGDLTPNRYNAAGSSSAENGYHHGGRVPTNTGMNNIDKFPFASEGNASDIGNLVTTRYQGAGNSAIDQGYGYSTAGSYPATAPATISKFAYATDGNATAAGDLTTPSFFSAGQSSKTDGYVVHGYKTPPVTYLNNIDKFPFASDVGGVAHGTHPSAPGYGTIGMNSATDGYQASGNISYAIHKFPFSSDTGITANTGVLSPLTGAAGGREGSGQSSTQFGYVTIGELVGPAGIGYGISKFPFSSDVDATAVGDLSNNRKGHGGNQV